MLPLPGIHLCPCVFNITNDESPWASKPAQLSPRRKSQQLLPSWQTFADGIRYNVSLSAHCPIPHQVILGQATLPPQTASATRLAHQLVPCRQLRTLLAPSFSMVDESLFICTSHHREGKHFTHSVACKMRMSGPT